MGKVQEQFHLNSNDHFILSPGEYEGPLLVDRSCIVDGCHSTLWANCGPVLTVSAPDVTIKNLRVEVTGNPVGDDACTAIKINAPNTKFENIEVHGQVIGLPGESEVWNLPSILSLGDFAANQKNIFSVCLQVPCEAKLNSKVKGLQISPTQLISGENHLTLTTENLRDNTILYGEIMVQTSVLRRIYITGNALNGAPIHNEASPVANGPMISLPVQLDCPKELIAPQVSDTAVRTLKRGQRISTKELNSSQIKIIYEHRRAAPGMEIDSYCFALQGNGKVACDEDLVFFGNMETTDHSIQLKKSNPNTLLLIHLDQVALSVSKIAVCYSIYGKDVYKDFSMVSAPAIRIFGGEKEVFRFALNGLSKEKTVVATEIYRYKGEWKMNFVGAGYNSGLKQLCESYGIMVE